MARAGQCRKNDRQGIIAKKEELSLALQQSGYRNKLILLGVFFITNLGYLGTRHHWNQGLAKRKWTTCRHEEYTTYNTPTGHAKTGICRTDAPVDPNLYPALPARRIAIYDQVMQQTGLTVSPFLAGYQPVPGELDESGRIKNRKNSSTRWGCLDGDANTGRLAGSIMRLIRTRSKLPAASVKQILRPAFRRPIRPFDSVRNNLWRFATQLGPSEFPSREEKALMDFDMIPGIDRAV